jgi:hypothetical protein
MGCADTHLTPVTHFFAFSTKDGSTSAEVAKESVPSGGTLRPRLEGLVTTCGQGVTWVCLTSPRKVQTCSVGKRDPASMVEGKRWGRAGRRPPTGDGPIRQCRAWPASSSDEKRPGTLCRGAIPGRRLPAPPMSLQGPCRRTGRGRPKSRDFL